MLDVQQVTLSRGGNTLVEDATFRIARGEKVGLVGVNGAGKTTLLRAIHGALDPTRARSAGQAHAGYLGQERLADALDGGATVRDVMLAGRNLHGLAAELRAIEAELATGERSGGRRRPRAVRRGQGNPATGDTPPHRREPARRAAGALR